MVVVPAENIQFGTFLFLECFKNISFLLLSAKLSISINFHPQCLLIGIAD